MTRQTILRVPIDNYAYFLLVGLLPWNFFSSSLNASTQAITGNANLIRKVYFPWETLPIATALFTFFQLLLALAVFLPALVLISGVRLHWTALLFVPLLLLHLLFTLGVAFILATCTSRRSDDGVADAGRDPLAEEHRGEDDDEDRRHLVPGEHVDRGLQLEADAARAD